MSVSAVSPDNGSLSYKWQKDGEDITGIEAASYTIPAVTLSDGGDYSVSVVNQNQREKTAGEVDGGSCRTGSGITSIRYQTEKEALCMRMYGLMVIIWGRMEPGWSKGIRSA